MQFVCIFTVGEAGIIVWDLWQISYAFRQYKSFENQLRFDKITESLKVQTFFWRHSVVFIDFGTLSLSYYYFIIIK